MKIIGISDTHGETSKIEIPACDILLHAGDICPDAYAKVWTRKHPVLCVDWLHDVWLPWITPMLNDGWIKEVAFTWGNHDWTQSIPSDAFRFLPPNVHLLVDEEVTLGGLRVWGTPWSNQYRNWAWMHESWDLAAFYDRIPSGVDIILSHQPPRGDAARFPDFDTGVMLTVGSAELVSTMARVAPKAVVCGHVHSGHGVYHYDGVKVYNVSVVDEAYRVVHAPTEIIL